MRGSDHLYQSEVIKHIQSSEALTSGVSETRGRRALGTVKWPWAGGKGSHGNGKVHYCSGGGVEHAGCQTCVHPLIRH